MTSKALPNNFHPARQLFAYSLKRTAGLTVLMTVVALLACPVYTLLKIERIYENTARVYNLNTIAPTLMFITAIASVAAALVYKLCVSLQPQLKRLFSFIAHHPHGAFACAAYIKRSAYNHSRNSGLRCDVRAENFKICRMQRKAYFKGLRL